MSDSREIFTLHDALLRSLGEGVYGINPEGHCTFINTTALSLLGYREEEILGKDPHLLFHNRDENGRPNPRENCPAFLTMQDGVTRRTEEDFITKDGRRILVSITAAPILNGHRITGAVVVFQDMTEIRLIQGVAREGYEIQRAILDTSLSAIVYLLDRHILWVNKRTEEMFGYTANEMQGMNTGLLYESSDDYLSLGKEAYPRLADGDTYSSERLMKRKDGSLFWCLLNGRLSDPKKPELGSVWTLNDIDELHHQKEAIKESEERYRQIFEINSAIKLIIDLETNRIVDANNAACLFYGYSKNELLNLKISDINCLSPDQIKVEMSLAAEQKRLFFEFRHRLASGEIRDVEVYSGPVLINGRKHLHSIIHDVTEKKKAESQLRLAARAVDQAGLGRDLRAGRLHRLDALARRQARRHDVLDDQHAHRLVEVEAPAQRELTALALDIHRGQTHRAAHLVAGHDAADRRRDDGVDPARHLRLHLGGQRLGQLRGALGVLEDQRLLQEGVAVQPARQHEMAFQQGPCLLELLQNLLGCHVALVSRGCVRRCLPQARPAAPS